LKLPIVNECSAVGAVYDVYDRALFLGAVSLLRGQPVADAYAQPAIVRAAFMGTLRWDLSRTFHPSRTRDTHLNFPQRDEPDQHAVNRLEFSASGARRPVRPRALTGWVAT